MKNKLFRTVFKFPKEYESQVSRICREIKLKDDSFNYKIVNSWYQPNMKVLIIYSNDKDKAFKLGEWFRNKVFKENLGIEVLYMVKR